MHTQCVFCGGRTISVNFGWTGTCEDCGLDTTRELRQSRRCMDDIQWARFVGYWHARAETNYRWGLRADDAPELRRAYALGYVSCQSGRREYRMRLYGDDIQADIGTSAVFDWGLKPILLVFVGLLKLCGVSASDTRRIY